MGALQSIAAGVEQIDGEAAALELTTGLNWADVESRTNSSGVHEYRHVMKTEWKPLGIA